MKSQENGKMLIMKKSSENDDYILLENILYGGCEKSYVLQDLHVTALDEPPQVQIRETVWEMYTEVYLQKSEV